MMLKMRELGVEMDGVVRLEDADDRRCDDDYVVNRDDRWSMMVILRRLPGVALVGV